MNADFDVVIFGSGFAAFESAATIADTGKRVGIIETGPETPDENSANRSFVPFSREPIRSGGRAFGASVPTGFETASRCIALGGTSTLWSGKWRAIDQVDLVRCIGERQWPFAMDTLQPFIDRLYDDCAWPGQLTSAAGESTDLLARVGLRRLDVWEELPPRRLRSRWETLAERGNVNIRCNTSVIHPEYAPDGRTIDAVRVRQGDGEQRIVAKTFIVACGGIESVHVSHRLRWTGRRGEGAEPTWYGGFMDHPKASIGHVRISKNHGAVESLIAENTQTHRVLAIGLPEPELLERGVGNHTVLCWPSGSPGDRSLQLTLSLEQFPENANRVHCIPQPGVAWRISRETWQNARVFLDMVRPRIEAVFGQIAEQPNVRWTGASHHIGALPMGSPGVGVVDSQLRFHDTANLYCASSAVFPIAGSANPTLTIMALAQRLGDHVERLL